jgi:hypothetical protein
VGNTLDPVYSGVIVTGQTPDGQPVRAYRGQASSDFSYLAAQQLSNPSFDTNTTGWLAEDGSIARDTSVFNTSPASLRVTSDTLGHGTAAAATAVNAGPGTFAAPLEAGRHYVVRFQIRREAAATGAFNIFATDYEHYPAPGSTLFADSRPSSDFPAGQFVTYTSPVFTIPLGNGLPHISINCSSGTASSTFFYIDSVEVFESKPTIVERRGFRRTKQLPIDNKLPDDHVAAEAIGDIWLTDHRTTPFKGPVNVYEGAIRDPLTGRNIGLEELLGRTQQIIRFADRGNPDTGGWGRPGRMTKVKWINAEDRAELTIDNSRASFEALMARVAGATAGIGGT